MYLFARNWSGSLSNAGSMRIYGLTVKDSSNNVIRDFVPVKRNSDSKPGMFETVTQTFLTNAASGTDFSIPA